MKKSIKIVAVAMVVLMLCLSLFACGAKKTLNGEYEMGGVTYKFSSDETVKISYTTFLSGQIYSIEGEYKIDEDEITFTFEDVEEDKEDDAEQLEGTFTFEEGEDYIKIGNFQYDKVEE